MKAIEFEVQELTDVILFSNSSSSKRKGKAQTKAERIRGKCCIVGCKGTWVPEHGSRKETCSPECANQMKLLNLAIRRGNKNSIMMNNKPSVHSLALNWSEILHGQLKERSIKSPHGNGLFGDKLGENVWRTQVPKHFGPTWVLTSQSNS